MKKISLLLSFLATIHVYGQPKPWNIEKPMGPSKTISFTLNEGTWMDLDVSPDGKNIVFDLLGDIYKMPISGGRATLLSGGLAYDVQPRFSPDGKYISYTSDKSGADNIWIMNTDGTGKRQITKESFRLLNNATWTPDGQYLIARKHFTGFRSLGAGEMWMYHINGGDGIQLTKRKNDQQDYGEPVSSPDGKYLYYSEDVSPGPFFQYNKDPNGEIYEIKRLNRETGETTVAVGGAGGAVRPQPSPDGKMLAFVKRVRLKSTLFIKDLNTGEEWPVFDDLSRDQQETWAIFGCYPGFAWTPDSKNIIFYAKGKIKNLDVDQQIVEEIPFQVNSTQTITEALHFDQTVFSDKFESKMIRQLCTSPDGKTIAFNAAGHIYIKALPNGEPKRITNTTDFEYDPTFSTDGKYLIYVNWNDDTKCTINRMDLRTGSILALVTEKGYYFSPRVSNKSDKVVYTRGAGNSAHGFVYGTNPGIYMVDISGGKSTQIYDSGIKPSFSANDTHILYQSSEGGKHTLKSMNLTGGDQRTLFTSTYANQFVPSPDGKWLAFTELYKVYVTPLVTTNTAQELSSSNKSLPLTRLSGDAGTYIHWSNDSKALHWSLGPKYFTETLGDAFAFVDDDSKIKSDTSGLAIGLTLNADKPDGKIAFTNARIITMKGDEVINNGTILIEKNKIIAVGSSNEVKIPDDALVIPSDGKTIMPGIIDVHAHLPTSSDGISPQQDWAYFANLAYGVTTVHDPSSNTEMVFSQSEMVKSGIITGPRIYSTGTILYGADGDFKTVINSLEDARSALRRLKTVGAFSVKSYNQPRREQRQQIIQAARELQMQVVPEGGSTFFHNMSMIADGHTGIEHNIPVVPVYKDVKSFWNASKTGYTPTLIVSYGSQSGENFWYDRTNVWEKEKLLNFIPRSIIDSRARRRTTSEFGDYGHIEVSKAVKKISDGGTKVNLGGHGQLQGLGSQWELWMLAQGGMSPLQAIRCATINGASYLGMDKEIGSLEVGKLADLIVMNENPLDDIRNTETIQSVMVNGRLFDTETMNQTGNYPKQRGKFWWSIGKGSPGVSNAVGETAIFTSPDCD